MRRGLCVQNLPWEVMCPQSPKEGYFNITSRNLRKKKFFIYCGFSGLLKMQYVQLMREFHKTIKNSNASFSER